MGKEIYDKEFLSIKEFAGFSGIAVSALRYYDKMGIFRPARHGIDLKNTYRYYSPTQITTVKMIRVFREIGVPVKTIKEMAENRTPEKLIKLLSSNKNKIADEINFLQEVHSVISTYIDLIYEGIAATETEITLSKMPEKRISLGNRCDYSGTVGFMREFTRFCSGQHEPKINTSYPIGGYWTSMDAFLDEPALPMRFFSLDPKGHDKTEAGFYLTGYTRGYYGHVNDLPERMAAFAKKNGLVFAGPVYNTYLFDDISVVEPERYLLQASALVEKTRHIPFRRPRRYS